MTRTVSFEEQWQIVLAAVVSTIATVFLLSWPAFAQSSPTSTLVGSWGGSGRISYNDGSSESIRCNAYYTGGGNQLTMAIQCKSETNAINLRSKLKIEGTRASGDWEERTFNANGTASGKAGGDSLSLSIGGGGFTGTMAVSYTKSSHNVQITTQGIAMKAATMTFTRR
jgi:hypothetical protein